MKRAASKQSSARVKLPEAQVSPEARQPKLTKPRAAKTQPAQTGAAQAQGAGKTRGPSARRAAKTPVTPPVERPAQAPQSSEVKDGSRTVQRRRAARTLGATTLSTLTAALIGGASAQQLGTTQLSTSLPLTSVGDKLMWTVGDQDLRLVVAQAGRVQLDVYGAQFDPQDYRRPDAQGGEYGDESYGATVSSTFLLLDAQGRVVRSQNFGTGQQDWQMFVNDDLAAGTYTLRVQTSGQGKNTFALRLNTISAVVEADRLNVNVHAHDWIPALNVASTGGDVQLHLYDGDGPGELEAQLRDAQGHVYPFKLPVDRNLALDTLPLPTAAGNYTLFLRQPAGARQYSNTVAFSLQRGGEQAPLTVVRADSAGLLEVSAELVLPGGTVPTGAEVSVGERQLQVNGSSDLSLPPSSYPVTVQPTPGASTTLSATQITSRGLVSSVSSPRAASSAQVAVPRGGLAQVRVQVKPEVALKLVADREQVCVGDVVTFTATASTAYARQLLPADLHLTLPSGFEASGPTRVQAQLDAAHPASLRVEARATAAGTTHAHASLGPWDQTQTLGIKVLPDVAQIQLRRAEVPSTLPGEVVTVQLSLHNTSGVAAPYRLVDAPGEGLTALDPVVFSGELAAGESRQLRYRARVNSGGAGASDLKATLSSACGSAQQVSAPFVTAVPPALPPEAPQPQVETPVQVQPAPAAPAPVLVLSRTSAVRIPFDAPRSATQLVVAHTPPAGASYVPGSSVLNGKPLADPVAGPSGRLYWTTPGAPRGVLGYSLRHQQALPTLDTPGLLGRYALGREEVLVGQIDPADLKAAAPTGQTTSLENAGAVRLPLAGTIFRERDRVTVVVESMGAVPAAGENLPTINGHSVDAAALGQTTLDAQAGSVRREFYGVQLRPGENTIGFGGESVRVYLAGAPVTAELTPVQLVADGVQPIALKIRLLDLNGLTPGTPTVTIESSLDPLTPDARPLVASQQIKLQNGEGLLELPPISAPTRFTVRVLVGSGVISRSFEATPSSTRVGVGGLSLTGSLGSRGSGLAYEGRSQGYFETPLGAGKLYVAGSGALRGGAGQLSESVRPDGTVVSNPNAVTNLAPTADPSQGLPSTVNPLLRFPGYGDSSTEQLPLQGADPLAFRYEHPAFSVSYRQAALPIDVFSLGGNVTALSGFTRGAQQVSGFQVSGFQVSGFVAALPGGSVTETLPSNGTRIYRLGNSDVAADSQSVDLVSTDAQTGAQTLTRLISGTDYSLDSVAGVLYFSRPLPLLDPAGNAQSLRVVYRITNPGGNRQLAFGAQVSTHVGRALSVGTAAVRLDGVTSVGVRARYDSEAGTDGTASRGRKLTGDVLAAYAGGVMLDGQLSGKGERTDYAASLRYQDPGYAGLNAPGRGVAATASLDARISGPFGVRLAAQYSDGSYQLGQSADQNAALAHAPTQGGRVSVQGRYQFGSTQFGTLRLGAGVQAGFGTQRGLSALGSLGYAAGPLDLSVDHSQPLGSLGDSTQATTTTAAVKVQLAPNVTLVARDVIDWGSHNADGSGRPVSQQASVGLQGKLGGTNLSAGYELPNASGSGNRARFGVDAVLPLSEHVTVNLSGGTLYNLGSRSLDFSAGTSLRYRSAQLSASAGADVASTAGAFRTVLKAGLSYAVNEQWSLTADAARALGPADQTGTNLSASAALRAGVWQGLAYVRYQDGSLGGVAPQLIGEADLEYHQARLGLRAGVAARMLVNDPASLTLQPSVSGRYYLNDLLAVGIAGRAIYQPATSYSAYSLGLEGSVRALPGTWVTVGYNPLGFDGVSGNVSTRKGLYLRLDLLLDEAAAKDTDRDK